MSRSQIEDPVKTVHEHLERMCNMRDKLKILVNGSPKYQHECSASAKPAHQRQRTRTIRSATELHGSADSQSSPSLLPGAGISVKAVFDISELLTIILLYLCTKDLTHSLAVLKDWRAVILDPGSKKLRRILFLEPAQARDHLEYSNDTDPRCYKKFASQWPVIVRRPTQHSRPIVEVHPILLPGSDLEFNTLARIGTVRRRVLRSVPPSTYVFQPPLEEVEIICRCHDRRGRYSHEDRRQIQYTGGVTFGALLAALDGQPKAVSIRVEAQGVVLMAARNVKIARMAHIVKEMYMYNTLKLQKSLPVIPEAEFEHCRKLGSLRGWEAT